MILQLIHAQQLFWDILKKKSMLILLLILKNKQHMKTLMRMK